MAFNAANRADVRRAEKAAKLAETNRKAVLVALGDTPQGRQYFWDTLAECHIFETTFNDDPGRMAYLEGQRSRGIALLMDIIQFCPDQFIQAMREANERRTVTELTRSPNGDGGDQGRDDPNSDPGRIPLDGDEGFYVWNEGGGEA
jgi:hypothetical protein